MQTCDFLVIGSGVIGVNIAKTLLERFPLSKIILIDKELSGVQHASGRNSGVLHAGFYYTSDSLKAKFTLEGNRALTEYCENNKLPIRKCGKLVVAQSESDIPVLDKLLERGRKNHVNLEKITDDEARRIEPKVRTIGYALYSPETSSVDPISVVKRMTRDAQDAGIIFKFGVSYIGHNSNLIKTSKGVIDAKYVVNSAGLYADKIAQDFGFSKDYYLLPFKGLYLYSNRPKGYISTHIYPVPKLDNPFLGVHYTVSENGSIKVGPTAIPAFWREQYNKLDNFNLNEFGETMLHQANLFVKSDFNFKKLAFEEILKYYKPLMIRQSSFLCKGFGPKAFSGWGRSGIRAQLVNKKSKKLEMDFVLEGDKNSIHVLNAVSPAFTCSIPFAKFVVNKIETLINKGG